MSVLDKYSTPDQNEVTTPPAQAQDLSPVSQVESILNTGPSVLDKVSPPKSSVFDKAREIYGKIVEWSRDPVKLQEAQKTGAFDVVKGSMVNLSKDTAALGVNAMDLVKLEQGGVKEWATDPSFSLKALQESPSLINQFFIGPMIEDLKTMVSHPIRYTYERPVQQMLNLGIVLGGIGTVRGMAKGATLAKNVEIATKALATGDLATAEKAVNGVNDLIGKSSVDTLGEIAPRYKDLTENLRYQQWLSKYSPMSSRGVIEKVVQQGREVTPLKGKTQLGGVDLENLPTPTSLPEGMSVTEGLRNRIESGLVNPDMAQVDDAVSYNRWLEEKAQGRIPTRTIVNREYQGDYESLKPATYSISGKAVDTPNEVATVANHWIENLKSMNHPEHGQPFITPNYNPQGEIPAMPKRIYPWISIKEKAPLPLVENVSKFDKTFVSAGQVMRNAWGLRNPLIDSFEASQAASLNINNDTKWLTKLLRGVPDAGDTLTKEMKPYMTRLIDLQRKLSMVTDPGIKDELTKSISQLYSDARYKQVSLAIQHPDVLIGLYAQDALPETIVKNMSPKQIQVGESIKRFYESTANDMKAVGLPVLQGNKAYTRHLIANEFIEAGGDYTKIPDYIRKYIPSDMAFAHRTGEFDWLPSTHATLKNYVPIVEKKLAFQRYLLHWRDTIDQAANLNNRAGVFAKQMIINNMNKGGGPWNTVSNALTGTNYMLQLFNSARVALKHVIGGFPASISEVGFWTSGRALAQMMKNPIQSQELLKHFGRVQDIVKTLETSSGMDLWMDRMMKVLQYQPVTAAEYLESGINILGNLMKGSAKGIPPQLLRDYIWNKVTSVNFRGGWDIPKAFANPVTRPVFQYSLEPHKVWEYRIEMIKRALAGEKDIYGTYYGTKLIKYLIIQGAAEMAARAYGKSIIDTVAAVPYVNILTPTKEGVKFNNPTFQLGPAIDQLAGLSDALRSDGILGAADLAINYMMESGFGLVGQLAAIYGKQLPPEYKDDMTSYLLGLPEVEMAAQRNGAFKAMSLKRTMQEEGMHEKRIMRKYGEPVYPIIRYKRAVRQAVRGFLTDPEQFIKSVSQQDIPGTSVLDKVSGNGQSVLDKVNAMDNETNGGEQ